MDAIFTRRSVRRFLDKAVEQEKVEKILRAAMQAPSAMNGQPWQFLVIRGRENLIELAKYNIYATALKSADLAVIVLADTTKFASEKYWQQDLAAATQNLQLEAAHLGLGSVWLGTAPDEKRMEFISNLYSLDENLLPFSVIAIGYPKTQDANYFADRYDESRVKYIG